MPHPVEIALAFFLICSALAVVLIAAGLAAFLSARAPERRELAAPRSAPRRAVERFHPGAAAGAGKRPAKAGNGMASSDDGVRQAEGIRKGKAAGRDGTTTP
jgi:type IV secretory pathway TrbL component